MPFTSPLMIDTFPQKASSIASYYGFVPAHELLKKRKPEKRVRVSLPPHVKRDPFISDVHALVSACTERGIINTRDLPLFLYHVNNECGQHTLGSHPRKAVRVSLAAFGMDKSIAEAVVLHTASIILQETGTNNFRVHINGIGDRDSAAKFVRETHNYLRKHINDMPVSLQTALKRDLFYALESIVQREHPLRDALPRPMQFLTDQNRRHLREVLEYLEGADIPYAIDDILIGHKDCYSQTVFELRLPNPDDENEEMVAARGGRFDELTRRFFRAGIPGAGIVIEGGTPRRAAPLKSPTKRPRVCLINIGLDAKRKSLMIIELLRKARVPLHQALGSDHLGDQLAFAETLGAPYALIIGQREALDGTVIIRDMETQSQQTVSIEHLPTRLRDINL